MRRYRIKISCPIFIIQTQDIHGRHFTAYLQLARYPDIEDDKVLATSCAPAKIKDFYFHGKKIWDKDHLAQYEGGQEN